MKTFTFEGYSDDTLLETTTMRSIDNCASGEPMNFSLLRPDGSGVIVTGQYGQSGCWMLGVEAAHEEMPVRWRITIDPCFDCYRGQMTVEADDDATLSALT